MKLPDFINNDSLNNLRFKISAPLSLYKVTIVLPKPIIKERIKVTSPQVITLPVEGLDVLTSEITVHIDGTLLYKGKRVLVHIRDVLQDNGKYYEPKFHLVNCKTLIEMKSAGRFQKYVAADRDTGIFYVRYGADQLKQVQLDVCQNCLDRINWKDFKIILPKPTRFSIVKSFSIKEFFQKFPPSISPTQPKYTAETAPINDYPENWNQISDELKRQVGYRCQNSNCGINVGKENKRLLHVHHKNGVKYDCTPENLVCLCIKCHSLEFNHSHLKDTQEYKDFIDKFY
ncbi:MAG: hypothetical protein B7X52_01035 [Thiotrichales bacterium 34-46-19]|nr:MAG: hypothetical protein B7X52_01035 [Thiotrichales bacterium 34-46-19]